MRVVIIRPPPSINGFRTDRLRVGHVYDLSPDLASLLIVENYARFDMRSSKERRRYSRGSDRRGA